MGKRYLVVFLTVLLAAMMIPSKLGAQAPGSEADVIKNAAALFEREDYPAAMPLYSQLLANHPKDPNYNYRFGVCMLFANADKGKALPFLEEASKDPKAEIEVWFYLGRAYHLNYRFDEAITAYNKYKTLAGVKKSEKMQVDNQIAMCKTGKKLLKAVTDITVLEKKELPLSNFFRSYNLEGYSGQLLVKGDEFKTSLDKKKNETSIIFLSGEKNILYYSSYGDDESNGKDIYRVVRLPTGGWSKPYNVGYPINTEYDEDYPFLHPNGKVLYFSSEGHNSMGGYDIFRSELNEETGSWLKPENMDFAINSPDDDILFVTDMEEKTAWFASARNSPQGFMTVYHVVIERKPVNMCIIAGTFKPSGVDPTAGAKITVRNEETNQPIGVYKSNDQSGAYLINLPNTGGKYTFTVEKSGIHTQTKAVFIPPQYELKPIRQEIFYTESNGEQNLNIVTYFDDDTASFAPDFLKEKANLDVEDPNATNPYTVIDLGNPGQNNPGTVTDPSEETDSSDIPGGGGDPSDSVPSSQSKVTTQELVNTAYENADETEKEAATLKQQTDRAYTYAEDLNQQAKAKQAEADAAKTKADGMPDGPEKTAAQNEANNLQAEANALQSQTVAAFNVAEALGQDTKQKEAEAKLADDYAKTLDAASKSSDPKAMDAAVQKERDLNDMSDVRPQGEETAKNLREAADNKREKLQEEKSNGQDLREEKAANEEQVKGLEAEMAKEKDPDAKAGYASQIEGIRENIVQNDIDIKKSDAKVASLESDVNDLDNQATAANNALVQSKNPAIAPVPMTAEQKKELGENVVAYQNRVEDSGNPVVIAPVKTNPNTVVIPGVVEEPNTQEPVTQNPNTQNPDTQEPNTQEPVTQNPNTQNPNTQEPNTQEPVTQNPNTQEPNTQEPVTQNPNTQQAISPAVDVIADVQGGVSEKIQEAENENDPVKKEELIGDAHREAASELDEKITAAETQIGNETDPERKKDIQANIVQFREEKKRQEGLAAQSDERAQEAVASTQTNEQPADPFAEYTSGITAADTISDPAVKENVKAATYADWATALDSKIADDKKLLAAAKTKPEKDSLKALIAAEQKESTALKQQSKEAKQKEQEAIAQKNSPGAKSDNAFSEQVTAAEQNPNAGEREAAKEAIYTTWADSLENEATKLDAIAAKERNAKKKADIVAKAQELRTQAEEKRELAEKSHDASEQAVAGVIPSVVEGPNTQEPVVQNAAPGTVVEQGVTFADPEATQALDERDDLKDDAKALRAKQDSLIAEAGTVSGEEKTELLADASEAQRQAWAKDEEASAKQGEANTQQFDSNTALLDGYKKSATENSSPAVEAAALLTDEAVVLLQRAKDKRAEAKLATSQYQRSQALSEAEDLEQQALKKQQEAVARYQQAGVEPGAVAQNPNTQEPVVIPGVVEEPNTQEPVTQNLNTQEPITQNPNTQEPNTQEPVVIPSVVEQPEPTARIVNPATGDPYTPEQVQEIRETPEYTNYVALEEEATDYDQEVTSLTRQAEKYQASADENISQAQDFAVKAADETDPAKKREYLDESKRYNEAAKSDMAKRDSVKDLVENTKIEANAKHAEADLYLNELDKKTYEDVKTVGDADINQRNGNPQPNTQEPVTQNPNTQNQNTQEPVVIPIVVEEPNTQEPVTQNPNTQNPNTQEPVVQNPNTQNPNTQSANPEPGTNTSRVATQLKPGEQFKITSQPNVAPIPVDPPVPSGIVYKVQIGAFRNPIPLDLFKGIQPVTAESAGNGITRYTAGLFTEFANADAAKREIRAMGYPDAFVVAFRDGKRISVAEARGANNQNPVVQNPNTQEPNAQQPNTQNPNTQTPNTQNPNTQTPVTQNNFEAPATDVKTVQGLFYTVQVGVYSRPVSAARLFNLTGLFSERTQNGYIRYACGKYNNVNAAIAAKNGIVNTGIKDAFVTAYFEGQRITLDRAAQLERDGVKPEGNGVVNNQPANNPPMNNPPTNNQPVNNPPANNPPANNPPANNQPVNNPPANNQPVNNPPQNPEPVVIPIVVEEPEPVANPIPVVTNIKPNIPDTGLVFCVQLGAYRDVIPVEMANRFLQFASRGVSIYRDENSGLTVYQVGVYVSYADAATLKDEALAKGISDAFIVAWKDGAKISMEEALKLRPQGQ